MKYLIEHHESFYFRRKLQYTNFCISLKTKNKLEAKYILVIINSKLEALRDIMDFYEEIEYIKKLLKQYVDIAKDEYGEFAKLRANKYKYTKKNGKTVLGSHPKAISNALKDLQDSVYSEEKEEVAQDIIDNTNIKEDLNQALETLSPDGRDRLLDEVIKAEMELLYFDKIRNDSRTEPTKIKSTYIIPKKSDNNSHNKDIANLSSLKNAIVEVKNQEMKQYKIKTKDEVFNDYYVQEKDVKFNAIDKFVQPIKILLQSSSKEYLVDYTLEDFEVFFKALIYIPGNITKKAKIIEKYNNNLVNIAKDFEAYTLAQLDYDEENETEKKEIEKLFDKQKYKVELQSIRNVEDKYSEFLLFLKYCLKNKYIKEDLFTDNSKFSKKRFENVLKASKLRESFSTEEIKIMFNQLEILIETSKLSNMISELYIILIGLYSGMRVEEICKLKTNDIKIEDDIYYFDINGKVKTDHSIRKVPIHKDLIDRFNFIDFVDRRKNKKEEQLFDLKSIVHKTKLKYSHYFLRDFFTKFRDSFASEERIENNLISFHSLRHFTASRLLDGNIPIYDISIILGHTMGTVAKKLLNMNIEENETPRYAKRYKLKPIKENIDKLYLEDIQDEIESFERLLKEHLADY